MAILTNRNTLQLPGDVSREIIQKTTENSAVMRLARQITLPGRGTTIPVIMSDPEAEWVEETGSKPVSNPGLDKKIMQAYKLAVIVPISNEFARDAAGLYDALVARLPAALGKQFDATVFGGVAKPGDNFDTLATASKFDVSEDAYGQLVDAMTHVAANGGILNGFALSPQGSGVLLKAVDGNDRPLFINNVAEGAVPMILGAKTLTSRAAYVSGSPATIGFAGDWTKALYGTVEGVKIDYSSEATLTTSSGTINLFQQNMFAVRAEIEIGFRADVNAFAALTATL